MAFDDYNGRFEELSLQAIFGFRLLVSWLIGISSKS